MSNKAVFLDRDGTICVLVPYLADPRKCILIQNAGQAIARLNRVGFKVVMVSNQSGLARGFFDIKTLDMINEKMKSDLKKDNASLDAIFYCSHHPDDKCKCRKPRPDLILKASNELDIDLMHSYFIGDMISDIEAGQNAGCTPILVRTGYGEKEVVKIKSQKNGPTVHVSADLSEAVDWIITRDKKKESK